MRKILIIVLFSPLYLFAQYEVLEAKKIRMHTGEKVRKGDFLSKTDTIFIADKGYLTLDVESAMHMKLAPGKYIVGNESKRHVEWYKTHLELTKQLKRKGLIMCKFSYKTLAVPGSDRHFEIDRIELDQKGLVKISSDTTELTVSWANPDYKYNGRYHLVIRDFYNHGFIDIIEIDKGIDSISFFPGIYGHKHMYYSIIADDCRASLRYKIQVNSPKAYTSGRTIFRNPDN